MGDVADCRRASTKSLGRRWDQGFSPHVDFGARTTWPCILGLFGGKTVSQPSRYANHVRRGSCARTEERKARGVSGAATAAAARGADFGVPHSRWRPVYPGLLPMMVVFSTISQQIMRNRRREKALSHGNRANIEEMTHDGGETDRVAWAGFAKRAHLGYVVIADRNGTVGRGIKIRRRDLPRSPQDDPGAAAGRAVRPMRRVWGRNICAGLRQP